MDSSAQLATPAELSRAEALERRLAQLEAEHAARVAQLEADVEWWKGAARTAEIDTENAEAQLRVMRRQLTVARNTIKDTERKILKDEDVRAIFDYWRVATGRTRSKLDVKRANAVKARLEHGHTLEEIQQAIDGAADDAFEKDGRRFDDLELICRDETRFDSFRDRRLARLRRELVGERLEAALRQLCGDGRYHPLMDSWEFRCPVCREEWETGYRPLRIFGDGHVECTACRAGGAELREALLP